MLVFYNGIDFVAVSFDILKIYPIIQTKYFELDDNKEILNEFDISIILCPFSMISCGIQGKIKISKYKNWIKI
jgi:hypothetical protein